MVLAIYLPIILVMFGKHRKNLWGHRNKWYHKFLVSIDKVIAIKLIFAVIEKLYFDIGINFHVIE